MALAVAESVSDPTLRAPYLITITKGSQRPSEQTDCPQHSLSLVQAVQTPRMHALPP